ncbi:hypothetical protein LGI69_001804 [Salmonella enterica]|uniref:Uncharacterized protein n=2 Tax=Salmonella diarizonae TaxID=59204 RepID=A0A8F5RLE5_SALDZ|nr:hypothetical protein [Salmonella enterica]EBP3538460.1 hypothetical protein [Salmonella enterica subsp. enterica]ECD9251479.1 hypothetical protein [Salmonella enterica subsp. diarizonae]HCM1649779.1 hypothetical protein [Salmonella enterica subsp. diarizonae serovar 48:i:z35]AXC73151.1 hypothetical protein DOE59_17305 [Salmonella enterica subsp. diarizonae serovar 48:i:z]EAM6407987.1 hypothetical protein [Salmonella enterica]
MQFNTNKVLTSIFFYGMVLVPGLLMVLNDKVGSNFIGIFFISTIILFLVVISGFNKLTISYSFLIFSVISFFLILFHFGLSSLLFQNGNTTFTKNITSLLFLFYILLACYFSSVAIDNITHQEFDRIVSKLFKLLIALGVLSSLFILSSSSTSKEMLFFTEPSHYALIVTIFYCYKISQKKLNLLYGIPLLFTALIVQNLTLIIGIVVAIAINYMRVKSMFIIMICVSSSCMLIAGILPIDKLSYYSQRLDISQESKNTSTLTLLSGYEQAYLALRDSYGLGYGLQNMGYANERGEFVSIIGRLRGGNTDSNLYDGGLFISKLIVEFGILGGIFFLYTLFLGVMRFKCNDKKIKFFSIVLIMSIIYFLLRGSGYFTPSAVMIFISIIYLVNKKNINKKMT